ncbi:pyranose dehydrogenase [Coprinellus micaceus]|uniref:pyranose dehydrogenase (acceptor) n=1 Tax=Coprinellus micaceus TaxID=71717 RepID=A0A4Y7SC70_COPMI|nr:pyranose dehydrogenase [Coprinellus micaceus]
MLLLRLLVTCALAFHSVIGKVYHDIRDLPADFEQFDFIIAGGGTAGCVLASRLSEERRFNVLVIEAGPDNIGSLNLTIPGWSPSGMFRWNYTSEPISGLNWRTLTVVRGHVLGGSSSINAMVYTRGSADDYDNWGRVTGDKRWSWNALWPYILRNERWTLPAGGRDPSGQYDPKVHGHRGKVSTSLPWSGPTDADNRTLRNTQLQPEFPFALDFNSGTFIGAGYKQSTIRNGERSSSATAYLPPPVRERPNLTILLNTYITRVIQTRRVGRSPILRTIEIAPRNGGTPRTIAAKKELILSGGVIGTAQILLNSGVGNATELKELGIPSVLDVPDVGKNLMEHVAIPLAWTTVPRNVTAIPDDVSLEMWLQNRTGPLTERFDHMFLFTRIPTNSSLLQAYKDPSTGPRAPHFQAGLTPSGNQNIGLMTPYSRGSVKLRSSNPFDEPAIDLNLLSHPFDIAAFKEAARIMKRWQSGSAWDNYITGFVGPDPDKLSDEDFQRIVRETAVTFLHPVGTARMSSKDSKTGVVDGELRVKGADGIRIVDASVFPYIPCANTQAPVYILAERAADLIKEAW